MPRVSATARWTGWLALYADMNISATILRSSSVWVRPWWADLLRSLRRVRENCFSSRAISSLNSLLISMSRNTRRVRGVEPMVGEIEIAEMNGRPLLDLNSAAIVHWLPLVSTKTASASKAVFLYGVGFFFDVTIWPYL